MIASSTGWASVGVGDLLVRDLEDDATTDRDGIFGKAFVEPT